MTMRESKSSPVLKASWTSFLLLVLLSCAVRPTYAQQPQAQVKWVDLDGTYYTERKGEYADDVLDKIRTPPGYKLNPPEGQSRYAPGCFQKGSPLVAYYDVQNNTSQTLGVVIAIDLMNRDDGDVYWFGVVGSPTAPMPPSGFLLLSNLPNHIANATIHFTFSFYLQGMGTWIPAGFENVPDAPGEIVLHTVLGPPQPSASMDLPWDEVLHIACKWMSRTSTASAALQKLTERMMGVNRDAAHKPYFKDSGGPGDVFAVWRYSPDVMGAAMTYTYWISDPLTNKVDKQGFRLRRWLIESSNGTVQKDGQCTEVSFLWTIMATAVGCDVKVQIINDPDPTTPPDDFMFNPGYWAGRTIEGLTPVYLAAFDIWWPIDPTFNYHQVGWANVYDAAIGYSDDSNGPYYVGWHDDNNNGIIDAGEFQGRAKLAINAAIGDYCDTAWLWAGVGYPMYRFKNPPLKIDFLP
jgi:hypothetical protein